MKKIITTCQGADSLPIEKLESFQGGLKKITKANLEKLKKRIIRDGINVPLFVWRNKKKYKILDGHQRLKALQSLAEDGHELPLIPVAYIDASNEKDARQKLLGITSQFGEFEIEELDEWLGELDDDIAETLRFTNEELKIDFEKETEGDDDLSEDIDPISKNGDLWELGRHRVLCGDSTDEKQVELLMNGNKADMVFTDPPYGIDIVAKSPRLQEDKKLGSIGGSVIAEVGKYKPVLNDDNTETARKSLLIFKNIDMIIWGGNYFTDFLKPSCGWIIWDKKNGDTTFADCEIAYTTFDKSIRLYSFLWSGMRRKGNRKDEGKYRYHPTQKPVGLLINIINDWCKNLNLIIDLFLGSGSTLIACEKTGRICYGMEIDPHYCDVIVRRYTKWCQDNDRKYSVKLNGKSFDAD